MVTALVMSKLVAWMHSSEHNPAPLWCSFTGYGKKYFKAVVMQPVETLFVTEPGQIVWQKEFL